MESLVRRDTTARARQLGRIRLFWSAPLYYVRKQPTSKTTSVPVDAIGIPLNDSCLPRLTRCFCCFNGPATTAAPGIIPPRQDL